MVIAGAGSGKTTVMAARVVWLVASGQVRPEQVLGLTFTNKAAGELAQRIRAALRRAVPAAPVTDPGEQVDGEPTVATYHAYAGRLLREHGLRIGLEPQARLLADATRFQLVDRVAAPGPRAVRRAQHRRADPGRGRRVAGRRAERAPGHRRGAARGGRRHRP